MDRKAVSFEDSFENLSMETLKKVIMTVARVTAHQVIEQLQLTPKFIKLNQAYKLYGRGYVDRWIKQGLITPRFGEIENSRGRICVSELEALASVEDIFTYEHELRNKRSAEKAGKKYVSKAKYRNLDPVDPNWLSHPY